MSAASASSARHHPTAEYLGIRSHVLPSSGEVIILKQVWWILNMIPLLPESCPLRLEIALIETRSPLYVRIVTG